MAPIRRLELCLKCAVMTGMFLLNFPNAPGYYYGNLSTYTNSYFRYSVGEGAYDINTSWIFPAYLISYVVGIFSADFVLSKASFSLIVVTTAIIYDSSVILSYFSVKTSVGLLLFTLMVLTGLTAALMYVACLKLCASKIMPETVGLATAVIAGSYGTGAIFFNYFITIYVNPDNLIPDKRHSNIAYFSQARILDKVPRLFIAMGVIGSSFHLIGYLIKRLSFFFLMRTIDASSDGDPEERHRKQHMPTNVNETTGLSKAPFSEAHEKLSSTRYMSTETSKDLPLENSVSRNMEQESSESYVTKAATPEQSPSNDHLSNEIDEQTSPKRILPAVSEDTEESTDEQSVNLKPSEVIRTRTFYSIFLCGVVMMYCNILNLNYFKAFGQIWIKDDYFFAMIGSALGVSTAIFSFPIGYLTDTIGVKRTLILTMLVNPFLMPWWYVTPDVNQWIYFVVCLTLAATQNNFYVLFPVAALKFYGPKYFGTNYGLTMTSTVIANLLSPMLISFILSHFGWFSLVLVGSVSSLLALISIICVMPYDRN